MLGGSPPLRAEHHPGYTPQRAHRARNHVSFDLGNRTCSVGHIFTFVQVPAAWVRALGPPADARPCGKDRLGRPKPQTKRGSAPAYTLPRFTAIAPCSALDSTGSMSNSLGTQPVTARWSWSAETSHHPFRPHAPRPQKEHPPHADCMRSLGGAHRNRHSSQNCPTPTASVAAGGSNGPNNTRLTKSQLSTLWGTHGPSVWRKNVNKPRSRGHRRASQRIRSIS